MNKVLINLYVPALDEVFELLVLEDKKLSEIYKLLSSAIVDISYNELLLNEMVNIYDRETMILYNKDFSLKENGIVNGTKLILV